VDKGSLVEAIRRTSAEEVKGSSRIDLLAKLIWQRALGWQEPVTEGGRESFIEHPPEPWAIKLVMEYMEGTPTRMPDITTDNSSRLLSLAASALK